MTGEGCGQGAGARVDRALMALVDDLPGPLALAVSGGGDSMALLHMLAGDTAAGRELVCLTVDHGLRAQAREEASFVASTCRVLGIAHRRLVWQTPRARQADARAARHVLLAQAVRERGARCLLTGHTSDDQDETFLMRARQGSSWFGLAGMDPLSVSPAWPEGRGVLIARPLLDVSRRSLRGWLGDRGLDWRDDPSNEDPAYERVRMRALLAGAPRLAGRVGACRNKLQRLRRTELGHLAQLIGTRVEVRADATVWLDPRGIGPESCQRIVSLLVQVAAGHSSPLRGDRLRELVRDIGAGGPAKARTFGGAWLVRSAGGVLFARDPGLVPGPPERCETVWDGRFERAPDAGETVADGRMSRAGLPPEQSGWRALGGQRLDDLRNCWEKLSRL